MAIPGNFKGSNAIYKGGEGILNLPALKTPDGSLVLSRWELSQFETLEATACKEIWLAIMGDVVPPVMVLTRTGLYNTFPALKRIIG